MPHPTPPQHTTPHSQPIPLLIVAPCRARKAAAALPGLLTPRLPLAGLLRLPSLPGLPPPPVLVPGRGLLPLQQAVDLLAPPLSDQEVIYYQSLLELAAGTAEVVADVKVVYGYGLKIRIKVEISQDVKSQKSTHAAAHIHRPSRGCHT